ncbi:sensor histidine kinase [Paenibacillus pectinilyticus]|nr:sensor histidine kinase [Paenibacillus pectinilyticus]
MKSRSIQTNLFMTYSIMIIVVSLFLVTSFYTYESTILRKRTFESFQDLSQSLSNTLDTEIKKMNDQTLNVAYANLLKEYMVTMGKKGEDASASSLDSENLIHTSQIINMLVDLMGPAQTIKQISLYDLDGNRYSAGLFSKYLHVQLKEMPWYKEVFSKNGGSYIYGPFIDRDLENKSSLYANKKYMSLLRIYYDNNKSALGVIEAQQDSDVIFAGINELIKNGHGQNKVVVYDGNGKILYPYQNEKLDQTDLYYKQISQNPDQASLLIQNPESNKRELLSYHHSNETGWSTAIVTNEQEVLAPLASFTRMTIMRAAIILLIALLFSFIAAKRFTVPIAKLRTAIKKMNWETISSGEVMTLDSGLNEIEELNVAFQRMNAKIKNSISDLLLSQSEEMKSKIHALQSQMNPHFLYNTLTTISVMAEANMNQEIVEMCLKLSYMLRYISSGQSDFVPMQAEIDYTETYLNYMQIRYREELHFSMDIDDALKAIQIPKLIIQPLVENALKYGINGEPPWHISITGTMDDKQWQITVLDNGTGFTSEAITVLGDKIKRINEQNELPSLELEGMGLANIYTRLKLYYGDQFQFIYGNDDSGGAIVKIGGPR